MALIDFPSVTACEQYREKLMTDPDAIANVQRGNGGLHFEKIDRCSSAS
jgi:hypothetical protein